MTPQELRGKRLFLILATLIILEKLASVGIALYGGLAEVKWLKSVALPLGIAMTVVFLWQGDIWLRWLVGILFVFKGSGQVYISGWLLAKLAGVTPPEATGFFMQAAGYPIGLVGVFGLLYVLAGLLFLVSPSMRAFFRYQREVARG
jgi:hypothetical protein